MIERLPGYNLNIPQVNYPSLPPRPVIPTAAYAAKLAESIGEIMKNLSPEERKKRAAQLEILGATVRERNARAEYEETRAQSIKQKQQQDRQEMERLQGKLPTTGQIDSGDDMKAALWSPNHPAPTTEPFDYWA